MTLKGATMPTTHLDETLTAIRERNVFEMARDADCLSPDARDSEGALMLSRVRDGVLEMFERQERWTAAEWFDYANDNRWEISDGAPSIYTWTMWQQFVDLGAFYEDPTELGGDGEDMNKSAAICLYQIADRLADGLVGEIEHALESDEADSEDEDDDQDEEN